MFIWHVWGDLWAVEEADWTDILARLIVSLFLALVTVVVIFAIITPVFFYHRLEALHATRAYAAQLPNADEVATVQSQDACPQCGNTNALDIQPCVRCGHAC